MCDRARKIECMATQFIALLDIDTATYAYHCELAKAKASAELASVWHDALVKYKSAMTKADIGLSFGEQPWVPDDAFPAH